MGAWGLHRDCMEGVEELGVGFWMKLSYICQADGNTIGNSMHLH